MNKYYFEVPIVARRKKKKDMDTAQLKTTGKVVVKTSAPKGAKAKQVESQIKAIIEMGKNKGYLTYEEMNDQLPEEAVSPARLDSLLMTLDELGIKILDEASVQKKPDNFEYTKEIPGKALSAAAKRDAILEKQLASEEIARRIDDPIRMYLTQMGEIPLLKRDEEIALARKIELARMGFRRKLLECDYSARNGHFRSTGICE